MIFGPLLLAAAARAEPVRIPLAYLGMVDRTPVAQTVLVPPAKDLALAGARVGVADDQTSGGFLGQDFVMAETVAPDADAAVDAARAALAGGQRLLIAALPAPVLLRVADLPEARDATILDAVTADDALRGEECRANVVHLLPSRAMLADALSQYLTIKRWRAVLIAEGPAPADAAMAAALRRSARKFALKVSDDKKWAYQPGAKRTDTGHFGIAAEAARFTQGISYDVLLVADTADDFGDDLEYRTTDPRPVAGTQGMVAAAWSPIFEQWGATQLQERFFKAAGRPMTDADFGGWMAARAVGEGALRGGSTEPAGIASFIRGEKFELAAFKGSRLTFRAWDGQLRQPVPIFSARSLVSVSPQPGFLHEHSELDTLGVDRPETTCRRPIH